MKRIGFLLNDIGQSQLAFNFVTNANVVVGTDYQKDIVAFYEHHRAPCVRPAFGMMQIMEAYSFDGPLVATTLNTAAKALRFPTTSRKFFYVWDLEWIRGEAKSFEDMCSVYRNDGLELIARSFEHKLAIESAWNVTVRGVVEDCDVNAFFKLAYDD